MLSSVDEHEALGLQSLTVRGLSTPEVSPMYWVSELCLGFVSFQSGKNAQSFARPSR